MSLVSAILDSKSNHTCYYKQSAPAKHRLNGGGFVLWTGGLEFVTEVDVEIDLLRVVAVA